MQRYDPFVAYAEALIQHGHDRHWIRRNEPALRRRFAVDQVPFPPAAPPDLGERDRYGEI
ncbi:hypothetical protein [Novosphingobium rosa]|uniref:hypothetical protein n=1 Tax=Novosphingobium rosa TaxID=76978 RepID=UPI000834C8D6|nr:hypothetical protein [Novosphingobium rosa]